MSPYAPSACPLCRTPYSHLAATCAKLHMFLAHQFPAQYAHRRQEISGGAVALLHRAAVVSVVKRGVLVCMLLSPPA